MSDLAVIEPRSLVELACEKLRELVSDMPVGTRLPSEREISQELSINRGTVREALRELQGEGLVVTKHGRGSFVGEQSSTILLARARTLLARVGARDRAILFQEFGGCSCAIAGALFGSVG